MGHTLHPRQCSTCFPLPLTMICRTRVQGTRRTRSRVTVAPSPALGAAAGNVHVRATPASWFTHKSAEAF